MEEVLACPVGEETPFTLLIRQDFQKWYPRYLSSVAWKSKRREVLVRDGYRCQCGAVATEVHHKNYDTVGNEALEDLISLCRGCHEKRHGIASSAGHRSF